MRQLMADARHSAIPAAVAAIAVLAGTLYVAGSYHLPYLASLAIDASSSVLSPGGLSRLMSLVGELGKAVTFAGVLTVQFLVFVVAWVLTARRARPGERGCGTALGNRLCGGHRDCLPGDRGLLRDRRGIRRRCAGGSGRNSSGSRPPGRRCSASLLGYSALRRRAAFVRGPRGRPAVRFWSGRTADATFSPSPGRGRWSSPPAPPPGTWASRWRRPPAPACSGPWTASGRRRSRRRPTSTSSPRTWTASTRTSMRARGGCASTGWSRTTWQWASMTCRRSPRRRTTTPWICISYRVGGRLISNASWTGVALRDVLDRAGPAASATHVRFTSADDYSESLPLSAAMDPDVRLVWQMNGEPLTRKHGYPLRAIVPSRYGMKNPKWITGLTLLDRNHRGYWAARGWSETAFIQTMSRFGRPRPRRAGAGRSGGPPRHRLRGRSGHRGRGGEPR